MIKPLDILKNEIDSFTDEYIEPVPGYKFNQYETLKKRHLYEISQFHGQVPEDSIFFNIVNFRRDNLVTYLDVDLKDIRLFPKEKVNQSLFQLYKHDVKETLKEDQTTAKLNEMATELASSGSVVVRHYKDHDEVVDLRNFFIDPSAVSVARSRFVIQKHYMTAEELVKTAQERGWNVDTTKKIIEDVKEHRSNKSTSYQDEGAKDVIISTKLFEVYERFGGLPPEEIGEPDVLSGHDMESYSVFVEPFSKRHNDDGTTYDNGGVVFAGIWEDDRPYSEAHLTKIKGRWLGVGIYETLFIPQQRFNEIANQRRDSMKVSTLHLFQTADPMIFDNILSDLENGDILRVSGDGLRAVDNRELNLAAFNVEEETYGKQADNLSYTSDINRGTDIPSTMPATNAVLANNNVVRITLRKREEFVFFIQEYINKYVLPRAEKKLQGEDIIRYVSEGQGDKVANAIQALRKRDLIVEGITNGDLITNQTLEEQLSKSEKQQFVKRLKNAYKGISSKCEVLADDEQRDINKYAQNTFAFLQLISSNPTLLDNPVTRELTLTYADAIGAPVERIEYALEQGTQQQAASIGKNQAANPQDDQLARSQ